MGMIISNLAAMAIKKTLTKSITTETLVMMMKKIIQSI